MSYKRNFLDRVIVRCELLNPWDIENNCPEELKIKLLKICPVLKERLKQSTAITIDNSTGKTSEEIKSSKEWSFVNPEKGFLVSLAYDHFSIEYSVYKSIDELTGLLEEIQPLFEAQFGEFVIKKLGVRYIDIFEFGNGDPLEWSKYISKEYLVTTETLPPETERQYLSRAFNRMEYTYPDEMQIIINYGIHNPNYPAPIRLRQYILDTDVQSLGIFESKDLKEKIETYQSKANEIFESAITDEVRGIMNE